MEKQWVQKTQTSIWECQSFWIGTGYPFPPSSPQRDALILPPSVSSLISFRKLWIITQWLRMSHWVTGQHYCGRWKLARPGVQLPVPGTGTSYDRGARQMPLRIFGWGDCPGLSGWALKWNHKYPYKREASSLLEREKMKQKQIWRCWEAGLRDGRRARKPRDLQGLSCYKLEKARNRFSPGGFWGSAVLPTCDFSSGKPMSGF